MPPKFLVGRGRTDVSEDVNGKLVRTNTRTFNTQQPYGTTWAEFFFTSPFGRVILWYFLLIAVCAVGSAMFVALEKDHIDDEIKDRQALIDQTNVMLDNLNITAADRVAIFRNFEQINSKRSDNPWTFVGGFFFCMSTALTIGWGNFTPVTAAGQWIIIPYSFIAMVAFLVLLIEMLDANILFKHILEKRAPNYGKIIKFMVSWGLLLVMIISGIFSAMADRGWNFREACYAMWISITTIGYGDYSPSQEGDEKADSWVTLFLVCMIPVIVADLTLIFDAHSRNVQEDMRDALQGKQRQVHADSTVGVVELEKQTPTLIL